MFDLFKTTPSLSMYDVLVDGVVTTFGAMSRREAVRSAKWFGLVAEGQQFVCCLAGHLPKSAKWSTGHFHGPYRLSW